MADKEYELRCFFLMDKFGIGRCTEPTMNVMQRSINHVIKFNATQEGSSVKYALSRGKASGYIE
jgi:hypothetical protein